MPVTLTDEQAEAKMMLENVIGQLLPTSEGARLLRVAIAALTREPAPVPDWRALAEELYRSCEKVGSWGEGTRVRSAMDAIENAMWPDIAEMEARERELAAGGAAR